MNDKEVSRKIQEALESGVTKLYLDHYQLTDLPPNIGQLTNLTTLRLDHNQLTGLPSAIGQLTNLQDLHLDGNQLTDLPSEIGQLTNLRELYLNSNQLTGLPPEIGRLTNLMALSLYRNQLTGLPPDIGRLTNLMALRLDRNQLTGLPLDIAKLTNLRELSLDSNQLTGLPPEVVRLTNLRELYLRGNQLTDLPPEIVRLTGLKRLRLDRNPWTGPLKDIISQGSSSEIQSYLKGVTDAEGLHADGLALYFNTEVTFVDRLMVDGVIRSVLGEDTDCHMVEFKELGDKAIVRLHAENKEDLAIVADALHSRVWEQQKKYQRAERMEMIAANAAQLRPLALQLSAMVDKLDRIELRQLSDEMLEMLGDKAEGHIAQKDKALLQTSGQKMAIGLVKQVEKKVGKELVDPGGDQVKLVWNFLQLMDE